MSAREYPGEIDETVDQPKRKLFVVSDEPGAEWHYDGDRLGEAPKQESEQEQLEFVDVTAWEDQPVPDRQWAVLDRLALRNVGLLSGEGGIGKTILMLHQGVAHVLGRDWLGSVPAQGPTIMLSCEDEEDELHRRLRAILDHYGARFADLRHFHLLAYAGKNAVLASTDRSGIVRPTRLFYRLLESARKIQPKFLALDNAADIFVGNENSRPEVRQFITLLRGLAIAANAGVLVSSHPSLTGINTGTGTSGSTAWHASVRSRMYFRPVKIGEVEDADPGLRELEFKKNQYGPPQERVLVRWKNGLYLPEPGKDSLQKMAADQKIDDLFLQLLTRFNEQNRNVTDKTGTSYAPALFAREAEAKSGRTSNEALAEAMRRLFSANKIHLQPYGPPSRQHHRLAVGPGRAGAPPSEAGAGNTD